MLALHAPSTCGEQAVSQTNTNMVITKQQRRPVIPERDRFSELTQWYSYHPQRKRKTCQSTAAKYRQPGHLNIHLVANNDLPHYTQNQP